MQLVRTTLVTTRSRKLQGLVAQATEGDGGSGGCYNGPPPAKWTENDDSMRSNTYKAIPSNTKDSACLLSHSFDMV